MNNRLSLAVTLAAAAALLCPRPVRAADDGQLWEISTHMDLSQSSDMKDHDVPPEVAARMADNTTKVCRSGDVKDVVTKSKNMKDCTVEDLKKSGGTVTMKVACKRGRTADIKMVYSRSGTSYTGTVNMSDPQHGDMTMTMKGKKIGTCDLAKAQQERSDRQAYISGMIRRQQEGQARAKAYTQQADATQIQNCGNAVTTMNPDQLGYYGMCYKKPDDAMCRQMMTAMPGSEEVSKACTAKAAEFCKRYQTTEGYTLLSQANKVSGAEQMCGVKAASLLPKLCKSALRSESYDFVGYNCPDQAAPLAKKHCAGRSYTSTDPRFQTDKWYKFCVAAAGRYMEGDTQTETQTQAAPASSDSSDETADTKGAAKKAAKKAALNALKGLWGH